MDQIDFEGACQYALGRLERELALQLTYHSIGHTRDDVVPAAERLADLAGVGGTDRLLLLTAAHYHDLGFVENYEDHEAVGIRIAAEVLPRFGYTPQQVQVIVNIIRVTRLPQSPVTLLEKIMADADLDVFGRDDFWPRNADLRTERAAYGRGEDDPAWYTHQLSFMRSHTYFTPEARRLRDAHKQQNLIEMDQVLAQVRRQEEANSHADQIALLRSVRLFAETPDEILDQVAALLQPISVSAGEMIIRKDEPGDCMYIILDGRVRAHDGEMTLNHLGAADVFGEMALLDAEPRSASVTAEETTHMFRLDQAPFYDLMSRQTDISQGVIRVLSRYLRARLRDMAQDFEYMQQMARISASAAALEAGHYDPRSLDQVGQRTDELGQLARVFQRMANEVVAREQRLRQEVQELRIQIDVARRASQVAEITESEYFQHLQQQVRKLRKPTPASQ